MKDIPTNVKIFHPLDVGWDILHPLRMRSHALARQLLENPDVEVFTHGYEWGLDKVLEVRYDPVYAYAEPVPYAGSHGIDGSMQAVNGLGTLGVWLVTQRGKDLGG